MKVFETQFDETQLDSISNVIKKGQLGFGPNVPRFEQIYAKFSSKQFNVATNSASAAAFMIFAYLKEEYGECDVYTTSLGFTSPAWAAKHFGHNLIWVDVNDNLLFDCNDYKNKRQTRSERYSDKNIKPIVMPVLYGGVSTIDNWSMIGDEIVVVDSAHCATPTIESDFVFFSFHPYKPICSSDGGMISTDNESASKYFETYRNFGRFNYEDTYDINHEGFKFYMNNLNATIAIQSAYSYASSLEERKANYKIVKQNYNALEHDKFSSYYFATVLFDNGDEVNNKYELARHYPMLHKTTYFYDETSLPNLEKLYNKIVNLPLWKLL